MDSGLLYEIIWYSWWISLIWQAGHIGFLLLQVRKASFDGVRTQQALPPVSVVICVQDEAETLPELLSVLRAQDHPQFEVILVDDGSQDGSTAIMEAATAEDHRIRLIIHAVADKQYPGKREALLTGLRAAQYERILVTDGDCLPVGSGWISTMCLPAAMEPVPVLGIAPLTGRRSLAQSFAVYESYWTAIQMSAFALAGHPYMGVGRNMLYPVSGIGKSLLPGGYPGSPGGDDDLWLQGTGLRHRTRLQLSSEAFVYSEAPDTWRALVWQKWRHVRAAVYYRPLFRFLLGMQGATHTWSWLGGVALLAMGYMPVPAVLAGRWFLLALLMRSWGKRLERPRLYLESARFDLLLALYYLILLPGAALRRKTW